MTATQLLLTIDAVTLVALVAVLGVRTGLAERATVAGSLPTRVVIRRLDVAAGVLAVACVASLVLTMVAGVFAWT